MRKIILISLLIVSSSVSAQPFYRYNSIKRLAKVLYCQDDKGFFQKKEDVDLDEVSDIIRIYGYDKRSHELYVETSRANIIVTLTDDMSKLYKKNKSIPQLREQELIYSFMQVNKSLEEKFICLNESRQKEINDSLDRARKDSIKKAREDSINTIIEYEREQKYRMNHKWCWVPTKGKSLYCNICDMTIYTKDSTLCYSIKNDSIYWGEYKKGDLGLGYIEIHAACVPALLNNDYFYNYHNMIYKDSLENRIEMSQGMAELQNFIHLDDYLEALKKKAPYGYFLEWGWDNNFSIEFNFKYMNTNKKTIKYIEVFWVVKNDVGDVRRSGSFRGTGPLKEWESASWNWDHSNYYVAGDATKMSLTKVLITYMDGTKITIPKNNIYYN